MKIGKEAMAMFGKYVETFVRAPGWKDVAKGRSE
jgi:hypothetical protein